MTSPTMVGTPEVLARARTRRRCFRARPRVAPRAATQGICGTLRAVVLVERLQLRRPSPSANPPLIAVPMAIGANPAMGVGVGMVTVIRAGHGGDAISHRMAMSVGSARKSWAAAHCYQSDACRRVSEWRDRHCEGRNGGQTQQRGR